MPWLFASTTKVERSKWVPSSMVSSEIYLLEHEIFINKLSIFSPYSWSLRAPMPPIEFS